MTASRDFNDWLFDGAIDDYVLDIEVQDREINVYTVDVELTVTVTGFKSQPIIGNLDATVTIAETIDDAVEVFQVTY